MNSTDLQTLKFAVHEQCRHMIQAQLDTIQSSLDQLMDAKNNETKSSAGDKYETGMAMIQNQEELYKRQQVEARKSMNYLKSIELQSKTSIIEKGSLVQLTSGWFYLSVALGKIQVKDLDVFALSLQSPLGALLKGKSIGDVIVLNAKKLKVESIH